MTDVSGSFFAHDLRASQFISVFAYIVSPSSNRSDNYIINFIIKIKNIKIILTLLYIAIRIESLII